MTHTAFCELPLQLAQCRTRSLLAACSSLEPYPALLPSSLQAFTAWVNSQLRVRQLSVKDIEKDLSDGRMLIQVGDYGL